VLKVALTGGIATGKSYTLDRLRRHGVPCLDADELAHGVMTHGTHATAAIAARFGDVLTTDGAVDRRKLAPIVFGDRLARLDLEAIVHPAVYRAIAAGLRGFELIGDAPIAVAAIPLLYETGRAGDFTAVAATVCPREMQVSRLLARGLTPEAAEARLAAQMPADEKAARAGYVIKTDGTFEETDAQIDRLLADLRQRAAR
jgi:dephospho-CoA kinase